jgi:subtilase family serine protease
MHGVASSPLPTGQQAEASSRKAMSLDAFPSAIDAFPASAGAFPMSLDAYAACEEKEDEARCHAQWRSDLTANPDPLALPNDILGYQPSHLRHAYHVAAESAAQGGDQTIAVVVAHHDPLVEADLNVYRVAFGMAPCLEATGCLTELWASGNADGRGERNTSTAPSFNQGWAIEEELDVEMVSAICPHCKIIVSEAVNGTLKNLSDAVNAAVTQGATEVSNSYTIAEASGMDQYNSAYEHDGVPITAAAGDKGYGVGYPASISKVTAVGGASLVKTGDTWEEAVWPGTGSGCSGFEKKPSWQTDSGCSYRTVNDLAVVADPATGVSAFVAYTGGWAVFGGTSVGAPIVAGLYALAGNGAHLNSPKTLYEHADSFAPITSRSNGTCYPNYLCSGGPGYDGPSGLGMPVGLSAF